jgi:DNA polymerase III subunit delta
MKLAPRDAGRFLDRPDPAVPGLLIFGSDPMRVTERRQRVIAAQIGPRGDAEMRLDRIDAGSLRNDGAAVADALKARGFFDGPRAVLVDSATETTTPALAGALAAWTPGDALLVVTAGELKPTAKLRKLFEGDRRALALAVYDDPPGRDEIERMLAAEGLSRLPPDALRDLVGLGQTLEPGEFRQTLTRIALYKHGDPAPLTPDEVSLLSPAAPEAGIDELITAVADGARAQIAPLVARLTGQGVNPVALCIPLIRHFRMLHRLVGDPAGPDRAAERLRPPLNFKVKDRVLKQARQWRPDRLDEALSEVVSLDFALRSSAPVPGRALAERALIRVATLARGGGNG